MSNIKELLPENHEMLKTKIEEFDFDNAIVNPAELANILLENLHHYNGLGLSANQIGLPYRACALRFDPLLVMFNPRIVDTSNEQVLLEEGCLSYPHLFIKIKRPKHIRVRYSDPFGNIKTDKFTGMTARAILHEMDHLDGIVFTTRANFYHRDKSYKDRALAIKKAQRRH